MIKAVEKSKKSVARKTRTATPSGKEVAGRPGSPSPEMAEAVVRPPPFTLRPAVPRKERLLEGRPTTLSLDLALLKRLDDWAYEKRLTRSAAARLIFGKGLPK